MEPASPVRRLFASVLDAILFFLTLIIGYIICGRFARITANLSQWNRHV